MSTKMKAAQIGKAGGDWELVERDVPKEADRSSRHSTPQCGQ